MNDTTPLETTPQPEPTPRRSVLRPILIGVGSAVAVLVLGIGGFAIADEFGDDNDDRIVVTSTDGPQTVPSGVPSNGATPGATNEDTPISSDEYDRVSAAALAAVGGGTVTELKRDDDPGKAWDVEITLSNGDEAEVELDASLNVLRIDLDSTND